MKNKKRCLKFYNFNFGIFILLINIAFFAIFFLSPKITLAQINIQKLINLTNDERLKNNLPALEINPQLAQIAENKCQDMIEENYFAHTSPSGKRFWQWFKEENYNYLYAGENLAMDFSESEEVVRAWLASATHRTNLLNPKFKHIGVAIKEGFINGQPTIAIAQEFGALSKSLTINQPDDETVSNQSYSSFVLPNLLNYQRVDLVIEMDNQKENYSQLIYPFFPADNKNQNWQIAFNLDKNNLFAYENDQTQKDLTLPFWGNKKEVLGESSFKTFFIVGENIPAEKIYFNRLFFLAALLIISMVLNLLTLSGALHLKSKKSKIPIANL
ncbi:MAG: CAP domain-containing protein [bacterium]